MIDYHVRSRSLVDIVNDVNEGKLVLAPHFQRKLVWRLAHKIDFIKTIQLSFPFPEVFISRGAIDLIKMTSTSYVVDGQQRLTTIKQFIDGDFQVDGRSFVDLSSTEKEAFLKYEIAVIDLDLSHDDPRIIDIFKRLNRTYYSLSNIEKISTEYASSEFMLVSKLISGEIPELVRLDGEMDEDEYTNDPNINEGFAKWSREVKISSFLKWVLELPIFSKQEIARQVHLMYTLNIISTAIGGVFNRNEFASSYLNEFAESFPQKDEVVRLLDESAHVVLKARFSQNSYWYNKANAFSLLLAIYGELQQGKRIDSKFLKDELDNFVKDLPPEYSLAAREAVNNKRERLLRQEYLSAIVKRSLISD